MRRAVPSSGERMAVGTYYVSPLAIDLPPPRAKLKVSVGLHLPAPWPERATHLSPKIYATTRHLAETENEITRLFTWQPCRRIRRVHCTRPQIYGVRRSMQFLALRIWGIPRDHPQKEKQGPCAVLVHV